MFRYTMSHLSLNQPFTMRSGLTIPNRMVKAAMAERLADEDDLPGSATFLSLYNQWAEGGWGLVITGEKRYYYAVTSFILLTRLRKC